MVSYQIQWEITTMMMIILLTSSLLEVLAVKKRLSLVIPFSSFLLLDRSHITTTIIMTKIFLTKI